MLTDDTEEDLLDFEDDDPYLEDTAADNLVEASGGALAHARPSSEFGAGTRSQHRTAGREEGGEDVGQRDTSGAAAGDSEEPRRAPISWFSWREHKGVGSIKEETAWQNGDRQRAKSAERKAPNSSGERRTRDKRDDKTHRELSKRGGGSESKREARPEKRVIHEGQRSHSHKRKLEEEQQPVKEEDHTRKKSRSADKTIRARSSSRTREGKAPSTAVRSQDRRDTDDDHRTHRERRETGFDKLPVRADSPERTVAHRQVTVVEVMPPHARHRARAPLLVSIRSRPRSQSPEFLRHGEGRPSPYDHPGEPAFHAGSSRHRDGPRGGLNPHLEPFPHVLQRAGSGALHDPVWRPGRGLPPPLMHSGHHLAADQLFFEGAHRLPRRRSLSPGSMRREPPHGHMMDRSPRDWREGGGWERNGSPPPGFDRRPLWERPSAHPARVAKHSPPPQLRSRQLSPPPPRTRQLSPPRETGGRPESQAARRGSPVSHRDADPKGRPARSRSPQGPAARGLSLEGRERAADKGAAALVSARRGSMSPGRRRRSRSPSRRRSRSVRRSRERSASRKRPQSPAGSSHPKTVTIKRPGVGGRGGRVDDQKEERSGKSPPKPQLEAARKEGGDATGGQRQRSPRSMQTRAAPGAAGPAGQGKEGGGKAAGSPEQLPARKRAKLSPDHFRAAEEKQLAGAKKELHADHKRAAKHDEGSEHRRAEQGDDSRAKQRGRDQEPAADRERRDKQDRVASGGYKSGRGQEASHQGGASRQEGKPKRDGEASHQGGASRQEGKPKRDGEAGRAAKAARDSGKGAAPKQEGKAEPVHAPARPDVKACDSRPHKEASRDSKPAAERRDGRAPKAAGLTQPPPAPKLEEKPAPGRSEGARAVASPTTDAATVSGPQQPQGGKEHPMAERAKQAAGTEPRPASGARLVPGEAKPKPEPAAASPIETGSALEPPAASAAPSGLESEPAPEPLRILADMFALPGALPLPPPLPAAPEAAPAATANGSLPPSRPHSSRAAADAPAHAPAPEPKRQRSSSNWDVKPAAAAAAAKPGSPESDREAGELPLSPVLPRPPGRPQTAGRAASSEPATAAHDQPIEVALPPPPPLRRSGASAELAEQLPLPLPPPPPLPRPKLAPKMAGREVSPLRSARREHGRSHGPWNELTRHPNGVEERGARELSRREQVDREARRSRARDRSPGRSHRR